MLWLDNTQNECRQARVSGEDELRTYVNQAPGQGQTEIKISNKRNKYRTLIQYLQHIQSQQVSAREQDSTGSGDHVGLGEGSGILIVILIVIIRRVARRAARRVIIIIIRVA